MRRKLIQTLEALWVRFLKIPVAGELLLKRYIIKIRLGEPMKALYYTEIMTTHQIEKRSLTLSLGTVFQIPIYHLYTSISLKLLLPMISRWLDTTQSVAEETCTQPFLSSMSWSSAHSLLSCFCDSEWWPLTFWPHPCHPTPHLRMFPYSLSPSPLTMGAPHSLSVLTFPCFFFLAPGSTAGIFI